MRCRNSPVGVVDPMCLHEAGDDRLKPVSTSKVVVCFREVAAADRRGE